jgi:hydrogenase maturation protein HypF
MMPAATPQTRTRARVRVEGTVQGVGFRPYVHRLASELALAGWVRNDERGVEGEIEGSQEAVATFLTRLPTEAPPMAIIVRVRVEPRPVQGEWSFLIAPSVHHGGADAPVAPDAATCHECLTELFDPADRRFRYPFINCTNCGPRFTIVRGVPYDRPLTTMAGFAMCAACRAEYEDPGDRRFHAQPNACPACGPQVRLLDGEGLALQLGDAPDPLAAVTIALAAGAILAVKGIGGYHLACRAADGDAVARLRQRKHREERPLALMVADLRSACALVELSLEEQRLLCSPQRPIVIARRRAHTVVAEAGVAGTEVAGVGGARVGEAGAAVAAVADAVAPHNPDLGLMLPYTPLHHLILADLGEPLVMTSGNVSDEPIAYEDADALARLGGVADAFLLHDRPIHVRTDDSVVRTTSLGTAMLLRRSRGYVPAPIDLPVGAPRPLLACGAELKSTFCVAKGAQAWVGHHIGDLKNYSTLQAFRAGIEHFEGLFSVTPEVVAHDLHPEYLSSKYALEREGVELLPVQHHHAHLAACLAEHGEAGPALGAVFDGSGYGTDGTVWGGELLLGGLRDCERVGHLRAVRLPGGDRAVREPWRLACAWLIEAGEDRGTPPLPRPLAGRVTPERWEAIARLACSELAPVTTSVGRLFDAVAALCGVRASVTYEGQAAIELEAAVDRAERGGYTIALESRGGVLGLDPRAAVSAIVRELMAGVPVGAVAARFHAGLARATARACEQLAGERGVDVAVLAGGVFQNRVLLELTVAELKRAGLRTLVPARLPAGDGGISYGQAAVTAARLSGG